MPITTEEGQGRKRSRGLWALPLLALLVLSVPAWLPWVRPINLRWGGHYFVLQVVRTTPLVELFYPYSGFYPHPRIPSCCYLRAGSVLYVAEWL